MKRTPKMKPMDGAPRDTVIDLWSPTYGWVTDVWWDDQGPEPDDGWVTICPRPFTGWRPAASLRQAQNEIRRAAERKGARHG